MSTNLATPSFPMKQCLAWQEDVDCKYAPSINELVNFFCLWIVSKICCAQRWSHESWYLSYAVCSLSPSTPAPFSDADDKTSSKLRLVSKCFLKIVWGVNIMRKWLISAQSDSKINMFVMQFVFGRMEFFLLFSDYVGS